MRNRIVFLTLKIAFLVLHHATVVAQHTQIDCARLPDALSAIEWPQMVACAIEARNQKDLETAIHLLRLVSAQFPQEVNPRLELAITLAWAKKYEEAQALYRDLLYADPDLFPALMGQAWVTAWQGAPERAAERFKALVVAYPEQMEPKIGLAFSYRALLHYDAARRLYREVLAQVPDHAGAIDGLEALKYAAKTDLTINTGKLTVSEGRHVEQQVAEVAHQLNRKFALTATAFRDVQTENRTDAWKGARVGAMIRLTEKTRTGLALFGSKGQLDYRYGISLDVNVRAGSAVTFLATLRPGLKNGKDFEWIAGGGFLVQNNPRNYFLSQCFIEQLAGLPQSMTCAGTYKQRVGNRFSVQPTLVWHRPIPENPEQQILDINFALQYQFTPRLLAGANIGFGKDNTQRLGFGVRFRR
ncbi:MAG TPA: hypothetical protein DIW24_04415 [Bacteroidetes bacterium]|nr:hypothetical protein [Bacteroidota bacterium]HRR08314.1 hypothetical protein [Rhodothermales bacterium]